MVEWSEGIPKGKVCSKSQRVILASTLRNKGEGSLGVLAVEGAQLALVAKGLGLSRLELGTNGLVDCGTGVSASGGSRAGGVGNQLEGCSRVLAVVDVQKAGVAESLSLAILGGGTYRILHHSAHEVALGSSKFLTCCLSKDDKLGIGVLAVVLLELAGITKGLAQTVFGLGADGLLDSGTHDVVALGGSGSSRGRCAFFDGSRRAEIVVDNGGLGVGVFTVVTLQLAGVTKCLEVTGQEFAADRLVVGRADGVAGRGGELLAGRISNEDKVGIRMLAVEVVQLTGVTKDLVQAVLGPGTNGLEDSRAESVTLGGHSALLKGIGLAGSLVSDGELGTRVVAAVLDKLASVAKGKEFAREVLGTDRLVDGSADFGAFGSCGSGHGGEDGHRGGDGQGDQGVELHSVRLR